jgi:hypothetical protein
MADERLFRYPHRPLPLFKSLQQNVRSYASCSSLERYVTYNVTPEIADTQRLNLPKATPQVVARAVEKNHGIYFKIAKAFEEKDWDIVEKVAEDDKTEFEKVRTLPEPIVRES